MRLRMSDLVRQPVDAPSWRRTPSLPGRHLDDAGALRDVADKLRVLVLHVRLDVCDDGLALLLALDRDPQTPPVLEILDEANLSDRGEGGERLPRRGEGVLRVVLPGHRV